MGRVLGATRLSHETDASTSIERQREAIEGWSRVQGHQVVAITEDTDVSGSIAPQDRDGLGPWLSSGKVGQWDVLAVAELDRVSRPLLDFASLLEWCQANGKALVSVAEGLDFGTRPGSSSGRSWCCSPSGSGRRCASAWQTPEGSSSVVAATTAGPRCRGGTARSTGAGNWRSSPTRKWFPRSPRSSMRCSRGRRSPPSPEHAASTRRRCCGGSGHLFLRAS